MTTLIWCVAALGNAAGVAIFLPLSCLCGVSSARAPMLWLVAASCLGNLAIIALAWRWRSRELQGTLPSRPGRVALLSLLLSLWALLVLDVAFLSADAFLEVLRWSGHRCWGGYRLPPSLGLPLPVFTAANVAAVTLAWRWRPWRRREHASPVPERRSPVQSITALKVGYAVLVIVFTSLTVALLLYVMQPRAEGDTAGLLRLVMPFGWVGFLAAWLGWRLARSLRLSPATAAGVALGSMMGGVNLAVFAWVMTRRVPRPD